MVSVNMKNDTMNVIFVANFLINLIVIEVYY